VHSRITLTRAQHLADSAGNYVFSHCSNLDNCYNRADFSEDIPECLLHMARPIV